VALLALSRAEARAQAAGSRPIQDNSFLIEEAYNQELGVVQHIQQFLRDFKTGTWIYAFTQEWPVPDVRHQLSFTFAAARILHDGRPSVGLGDLQLNYRYQLVGDGLAPIAVAPRVSLLVPTGSWRNELGLGAVGMQFEVPASFVLSDRFVAHGNAGVSWVPRARDAQGDRAALVVPNAGASLVWLARPTWNLLCEAVWVRGETVAAPGRIDTKAVALVGPGARMAWNFKSGLQVVGGLSVPIGVGPSRGRTSILLYLSFEHPFRAAAAKD
jgi:hypothetical protein